jgi:Mrp family chromosome partitioning ATPase
MSRMYDAIFTVEARTRRAAPRANGHAVAPAPPSSLTAPAEMGALYQAVRSLLAPAPSWVVQFVGPQGGEGSSTIARSFAWAAAAQQANVLLADGARLAAGVAAGERPPAGRGRPEVIPVDVAVQGGVSLGTLGGTSPDRRALADLRARFSLVVVDSPGGVDAAESIAIPPEAHRVVLVVEAERTRRPVVQRALARIADAGGRSLGVVLNRRRYHIPAWLYRRL